MHDGNKRSGADRSSSASPSPGGRGGRGVRSFHPIRGQRISLDKLDRSRQLRRDMTPAEHVLWQELRTFRPRGFVFRRQQIIAGFIVDFYCDAARLVVEVDGGIHSEQADYDAERDRVIAAHDLRVLRFTNAQIETALPVVVTRVLAACQP